MTARTYTEHEVLQVGAYLIEHTTDRITELVRIAISDDDAETRTRNVRAMMDRIETGPTGPAGSTPNRAADGSFVRGGVGGWNR